MLNLTWTDTGLEDLSWRTENNPKILKRIIKLCIETCKNPSVGVGNPEALRFDLSGYRSRRITQEHRLIYAFDDTAVTIIQCRFHYEKK